MLKYNDIIEKLSERDKLRILSDIRYLSDAAYSHLGLPGVRLVDIEDFCGSEYPSPISLANSWNTELVGKVADRLISAAVADGDNLVKVPGPKPKINPYRTALSEDPFLAAAMSKQYLAAAERADVSAGMCSFGLKADEAQWLDKEADREFVEEFFVKPYAMASKGVSVATVLTEPDLDVEGYKELNAGLKKMVSDGTVAEGASPVCGKAPADKTVSYLEHGGLFFEGSLWSLESALTRYKRIKAAIDHGTATTEELETAIEEGQALSTDMIDEALDRLLDFAFTVNEKKANLKEQSGDFDPAAATRESIVLVKNEKKLLPLNASQRVCIIGDIAMQRDERGHRLADLCGNRFIEKGYLLAGKARGYDLHKDRSDELLKRALGIAAAADVVLLFLGGGEEREKRAHKTRKLSIPANQQQLLLRLSKVTKNIVAILPPDRCPDVSLPNNCRAIMLAPLGTRYSAEALVDILTGKYSPCGKLASTLYANTDKRYVERRGLIERDGLKVGSLVGYRYYDTAGTQIKFPFGHGLSYSKFSYGNLVVGKNSVVLTVRNRGKHTATEVVQLYIGCEGKGAIYPKRTLCGFARVEVKPGRRKVVEIPYQLPSAYNEQMQSSVCEKGAYTLYIGSSLADIRMTRKIKAGDKILKRTELKKSDYIHTVSNIISDNFKLEAKTDIMRKSVFNFIAGASTLALAFILKMYCLFANLEILFIEVFAIILAVFGVIFFIVEAARRGRIRSEEKRKIEKQNAEAFKNAEKLKVYSAKQMFVKEFDVTDQVSAYDSHEVKDAIDSDHMKYIDKEQSFSGAVKDFMVYARERGYKLDEAVVRKMLASLAASRLIVVAGMSDEDFKALVLLVSNYFHTSMYVDEVDESYTNGDRMFYHTDEHGNRVKTNAHIALDAAKVTPQSVHLAALTHVNAAGIPAYFSVFTKYIKNPLACKYVVAFNDKNVETAYVMPQNLWFIMNLAEDQDVSQLPGYIADIASVNIIDLERCEETENHSHVRDFSYYQIDYLVEKAIAKGEVNEDAWKQLDRFEEYVNGRSEFKIGNKMWLGMEKFVYAYMAGGGEEDVAIDEAIAAKVMSAALAAASRAESEAEVGMIETLDLIFGEDKVKACKKVVDYSAGVATLLREREEAEAARIAAEEAEAARIAAEAEAARLAAEAEELRKAAEAEAARLAAEAAEAEAAKAVAEPVAETVDTAETTDMAETEAAEPAEAETVESAEAETVAAEAPVEKAPTEETPAEETPAEETPAEEAAAEEASTNEANEE